MPKRRRSDGGRSQFLVSQKYPKIQNDDDDDVDDVDDGVKSEF